MNLIAYYVWDLDFDHIDTTPNVEADGNVVNIDERDGEHESAVRQYLLQSGRFLGVIDGSSNKWGVLKDGDEFEDRKTFFVKGLETRMQFDEIDPDKIVQMTNEPALV